MKYIRLYILTAFLVTQFASSNAQKLIDDALGRYSNCGSSTFTSLITRDPKTNEIVKIVKKLELSGAASPISDFREAFKKEKKNATLVSETHEDGEYICTLVFGENRIYSIEIDHFNMDLTIVIKKQKQ